MAETLLSVGLDVGTTSTQMVLSRLTIENKASSFAVPALEISEREILYKSPVHFTPLLSEQLVDGDALRCLLEKEYRLAGISPEQVDTGAIIITGETSRKENARTVLQALSDFAGDFVVTTAGPDLESVLAAKGAGAVALSEKTEKEVLHMDIGGGTSNLALIREGKILRTGCLNVGGRLIKLDKEGTLTYISPVLKSLFPLAVGEKPSSAQLEELAQLLTQALEMAAGLRRADHLLSLLLTGEAIPWEIPHEEVLISFSGGVADCIEKEHPPLAFGDLGPVLGQCIQKGLLCRGDYHLGQETIRATVIGAGCHSTQLSGSTVFCRNVELPLKNLPVVRIGPDEKVSQVLRQRMTPFEERPVIAMEGYVSPSYRQVKALAEEIADAVEGPVYICLEQDMAKALGQALAARLGNSTPILCLDSVQLGQDAYLDVGIPVGPALPVVVKTLILER